MRRRQVITALACLAGLAAIRPAAGEEKSLRKALEIIDGHTIKIDGDILCLAGIEVPLASDGAYAQRWADKALAALRDLAGGKMLSLMPVGAGRDRYARLLVQVTDQAGIWLQGEMLRAGLARVWVPSDAPDRLNDMLRIERDARVARRGLWGDKFFEVLTTDTVDRRHLDRLQLVEGKVKAVATVRDLTYLNFGDDWRSDFTIEIQSQHRRSFTKAGLNPATLKDKTLRVRGFLFWRNGPAIDAQFPAQVELLT